MENPTSTPPSPDSPKKKVPILPSGCRSFILAAAILSVFAVPFILSPPHVTTNVRHKQALRMAVAIATGFEYFYSEYNKHPLDAVPKSQGNDTDTDSSSTHTFISILVGKEGKSISPENPRRTDFFEEIQPAQIATPTEDPVVWKNGIYLSKTTNHHGIADPWGKPFRIRLDTNFDKELANPNSDQVKEGRPVIRKRVLVWSAGKDGNWDTWDDNPMSWD